MIQSNINRSSFFSIGLIYFFLGFSAIIVQSILIREFLVIAFGNELIIGTIFAVWFFWIAIGASLGVPLIKRTKDLQFIFWLIIFICLILFPIQITAIRLSKAIFAVPIGQYMSFSSVMFWSLICISPFSLMIGLTFPLGAYLYRNIFNEQVKIIGYLYIFEALGSLVGGLLFTFLLVSHFNVFKISVFLLMFSIIVFLISGKTLLVTRKNNVLVLICILVGVCFTIFSETIQNWSSNQRWYSISGKQNRLITNFDTPYENISISRLGDQYSLFQNGHLSFSFPDPYSSQLKANLILVQHPHPNRMLAIGAGVHDLLPTLLKFPDLEIDWVVKDREIFTQLEPLLSSDFYQNTNRQNVNRIFADGRSFLQDKNQLYDLIYLDLPPPATASLNRFYTLEFFRLAKRSIKLDGILVFQLPISDNYLGNEVLQFVSSIHFTIKKVFKEVIISSGEQNYFYATDDPEILNSNVEQLMERWQNKKITLSNFSPFSFYTFFDSTRIEFLEKKLQLVENPVLNSDQKPISYYYNLLLWNKFSGGDILLNFLWKLFRNLIVIYFFGLCFLGLIVRIIWIKTKRKSENQILKWNCLASIAVSGFTAMGLEIILLFGFQNLFGSLYQNIALVTAIFMFGLAIGSWQMNKKLSEIQNLKIVFILFQTLAIIIAISLPFLFNFLGKGSIEINDNLIKIVYLFLVLFVGVITGAIFPLAGKGLSKANWNLKNTASTVDAVDHTGACFGAFLTGTFLVPVIGMVDSVIVVASLNILIILFWLISSSLIKKTI